MSVRAERHNTVREEKVKLEETRDPQHGLSPHQTRPLTLRTWDPENQIRYLGLCPDSSSAAPRILQSHCPRVLAQRLCSQRFSELFGQDIYTVLQIREDPKDNFVYVVTSIDISRRRNNSLNIFN